MKEPGISALNKALKADAGTEVGFRIRSLTGQNGAMCQENTASHQVTHVGPSLNGYSVEFRTGIDPKMTQPSATIAYLSVVHPLHDHRFLYKQCSGLVRHGFSVEYFVPANEEMTLQGVEVRPLRPPLNRALRFVSTFGLLPRLIRGRYAVYHLVDPELLPLGWLLKLLTGRRVIFDAHEDYVDFMRRKNYLPWRVGHVFAFAMRIVLDLSSRLLDGFVFADEGTARTFSAMATERKCLFYNFPLRTMFPEEPAEWVTRRYDTVFLGTMSETSGIWVILEGVLRLKQRLGSIRCLLVGLPEADLQERVSRYIVEHGLADNIEFTGRLPHAEIPALLQQCKVGLVGLLDLPKFHLNIATKMFEYLASGIPVVSSDLPPERRFIIDGECGLFFRPGDSAGLAEAVHSILADQARGERMSRCARDHIVRENYFAEGEIEKLVAFYSRLLGVTGPVGLEREGKDQS